MSIQEKLKNQKKEKEMVELTLHYKHHFVHYGRDQQYHQVATILLDFDSLFMKCVSVFQSYHQFLTIFSYYYTLWSNFNFSYHLHV